MKRTYLVALLGLLLSSLCYGEDGCLRVTEPVVGPCETLRGRLSLYNGYPSARVWPVGTRRLLGVPGYEKDIPAVPGEVFSELSWDTDVYADFEVCPLSKEVKGKMQFVCVRSAKNVSARTRTSNSPK